MVGSYQVSSLFLSAFLLGVTLASPVSVAGQFPDACSMKRLRFSADFFPQVPRSGSAVVWGGNATGGSHLINPPYSDAFISNARTAKANGLGVFAYLEGPCGDTGGVDDGETARCRNLHRDFNRQFAPNTPDTDYARWKPYTLAQMRQLGQNGADYCEIDNLDNNVTIPLVPLFRELKNLYDSGSIRCKIVLKNLQVSDINSLKNQVAPNPSDAAFIAYFHIFEANNTSAKRALDAAMVRLKGEGAVTIISTDTNHYGSAFTDDQFLSCENP